MRSAGTCDLAVPAAVPARQSPLQRGLLLFTGLAIAATLFLFPRVLGAHLGPLEHAALPLLLFGTSGAFVSGFGFRPGSRIASIILGPTAAWAFIAFGAVLMTLRW